jgi:3-phosphoshikimate 1-carboxyvinyltransferase
MNCDGAATVFRFLALRATRDKGQFVFEGEPELFVRPQRDLERVMSQLGVEMEWGAGRMTFRSHEWKMVGDALHAAKSPRRFC